MNLVRGVTVLDLIEQVPAGAQGFIPDAVAGFINLLNVSNVHTRTSDRFFIHSGRVQSADDAGLGLGADFPLEIPGLNVGVPFELSWLRPDIAADGDEDADAAALEGEPTGWTLDLLLDRVAVVLPVGEAARRVPASPAAPAHLAREDRTRVKLYARGVLRIEGGAEGTKVRLIADPDPIVPTNAIGTVIETGFSPPHVLLSDSGFGVTVDRIVLDLTSAFTPANIVARGHGPEFEGMTISEATVYFPRNIPFVGDINVGVRDLLVGWSPVPALQGEARVELGVPLESATGIAFFQDVDGQVVTLGGPSGGGSELKVTVHADTGPVARLFARMATPGVSATWTLPNKSSHTGESSGWFEVSMASHSDRHRSVRVTELRTDPDGSERWTQERTFAFVRAPDAQDTPQHAPPIRVACANTGFSHQWDDVAFLRGPGTALDFIRFSAIDTGLSDEDIAGLRWLWTHDGSERSGSGAAFDLDVGWAEGTHSITLTDRHGNVRRCRVEVVPTGALYVGHRDGGVRRVEGATDAAAPIAAVENSWHLGAFHAQDAREAAPEPAVLRPDGELSVPRGTLAEVTLAVGTPEDPDAPADLEEPPFQHARILMTFNDANPTGWRLIRSTPEAPYGPPEPYPRFEGGLAQPRTPEEQLDRSFSIENLAAWAAALPEETRFVVIGRCCDLGTETRNRELANERAVQGRDLLVQAGIAADRIRHIGEQGRLPEPNEPGYADALSFTAPPFNAVDDPDLGPHVAEDWAFLAYYSDAERTAWGTTQEQPERREGRGVDIYAVLPPAAEPAVNPQPTDAATQNPALIRALVPGEDKDTIEPPKPANVQLPYRVQILTKWDSPSIAEPIDWVPTLAEVTVEWASSEVRVPGIDEPVRPTRPGDTSGPDLWRVIGRFTTDPRSGQTSYLLSLDSMGDADGLFAIVDPAAGRADETVAVALALAPALLGGITTDDPAGAGVRIAALIGASAAAAAIQIDDKHLIEDGRVIVEKIEGEARLRAIDATEGMKVRLSVDYTASFGVQADLSGAVGVSTKQPVKIKYKNVGLEYEHDESKPLLERVRFVFEDASFEVADPGQWSITGALGKLLGITAIRVGAGSIWIEADIEFALDLGVVEISRTTLRVEIDTSGDAPKVSVSIRGIKAKINVPGTIRGAGELQVLPDGFGAALELDIIPAKLKAWGGFSVRPPMVHIDGGVQFATGLPLGSTGLGVFGFAGRFVAHGQRNLENLTTDPTDIIAREIGWHERPILEKYTPQQDQFALGFGLYIGTMPDAGFTFNALGMLTVGFPDVSVVFAIDATLMSAEKKSASEEKEKVSAPSFQLLGIVAVDPEAVGIAIRGRYQIPKTLIVEVPIGAYFPLQSSGEAAYVRIGSDGAGGRPDRPVTVKILPDVLDLRATAFFMVEEKQLHDLGGKPHLDFDGFSVGFGAGLSVEWGGDAIYLKGSISLLVGLGTRPFVLAGGLYVQGELKLVIVSISVSGELEARVTAEAAQLEGEFCAEVSFFLFSIKGCVSFNVGTEPQIPPPPAEPLVSGLVLGDKFSRVAAEGADSLTSLDDTHRAWIDAAPVLRFAHRVRVKLDGDGFRPTPSKGWPGIDWSGTNRVRYLYELNGVELIKHPDDGPPEVLDTSDWPAAWWLPAFRNAVPDAGDTPSSSHEGWDLALLQWEPAPWSRALTEGGEGIEADPARSVGNFCEPAPRPTRYCLRAGDGERLARGRVRIVGEPSGQTPYPPDFYVEIEEGLPPTFDVPDLAALAASLGFGFSPGGRVSLPQPFTPPGEAGANPLDAAWRLPRFMQAGFTAMSLGMQGRFITEVSEPELLLSLCLELPNLGGREEHCVDFRRLPLNAKLGAEITLDGVRFIDRGQTLYTGDFFPLDNGDGVPELNISAEGLLAVLPRAAEAVTVDVGTFKDPRVLLIALDEQGNEIARAEARPYQAGIQRLRVEARDIRQVLITAAQGTGHLVRFCYTSIADIKESAQLEKILSVFLAGIEPDRLTHVAPRRAPQLPLPQVQGTLHGKAEAWAGEVIGASIEGRHGCLYLRYTPPASGPWSGFTIAPYPWFELALVRVCGIRHAALVAADDDDRAREELQDAWNDAATEPAIHRHRLLDPDTRYEVRVRYKAATWVGADPTDNPPDANTFDFVPTPAITVEDKQQSLFFRTAAAGTLEDDKVLAFDAQQVFDPRALARYLRGFDPIAEVPSHFRDDPLLVWFEVEWIEDLLDRYGLQLELVVQRTDPPPTPPSGEAPVRFPHFTLTWTGLPFELRALADQRMIEAASDAPCLESAPVEGATAQVIADLEPRARYDLVVQAVPKAGGEAIEIGRSHFRASRYRTAVELVEASGFGIDAPNPFYPLDLIAADWPALDTRLGDDAALDAALTAMGLDPFAPAAGPRSAVIWHETAEGWRLAGLLLDSDEALIREPRLVDPTPNPPRLEILRAYIPDLPPLTAAQLVPVRSNASATRVLLAAPTPLEVPDAAVLALEFREPGGVRTGQRSLLPLPLIVAQERP